MVATTTTSPQTGGNGAGGQTQPESGAGGGGGPSDDGDGSTVGGDWDPNDIPPPEGTAEWQAWMWKNMYKYMAKEGLSLIHI